MMKWFMVAFVLALMAAGAYSDGPPQPLGDRLIAMDVLAGISDVKSAEALSQAYEKSGATAAIVPAPMAEYGDTGSSGKPSFASLEKQLPFKSAKTKILRIDLASDWARAKRGKSRAEYEKWLEWSAGGLGEYAKSGGMTYVWLPTDEYSKPGKGPSQDYSADLKIVCKALKSASDKLVLIAGPVAANDDAVQALYDSGGKGAFDMLMVDTGGDFPLGVDAFALVDAHRAMARNGDGGKKMLVVANWPKADTLDAARRCLESGLRNILTERDMYSPACVAGAVFTVSPNLREAVLAEFPPQLPQIKLDAALAVEGPLANFMPGKPYKLNLSVTNLTKSEIAPAGFAITLHGAKGASIEAKAEGEMPKSVPAGGTATAVYTVIFSPPTADRTVTIVSLLDYTTGGKQYFIDAWTTVPVTSELEVTLLPSRVILDAPGEEKQVGMSVINHSDAPFSGRITLSPYAGIKVNKTEREMKIDPFGLEAMVFTVTQGAGTAPGHYAVMIDVGGKTKDWVAVDVPVMVQKTECKIEDAKEPPAIKVFKTNETGKKELVGEGYFGYDDQDFYARFDIVDNHHVDLRDPKDTESGDSLVMAFDPLLNGSRTQSGGYMGDDYEYGFAKTSTGPVAVRLKAPPDKPKGPTSDVRLSLGRKENKSIYIIQIPWSELAPFKPVKGGMFGMSILVNQHDGMGRRYAEWGGGIEPKKDPRMFVPVVLN